MLALTLAEIVACVIIGLAAFLVVGSVLFNLSVSAYEALSDWRVGRTRRRDRH